MKLFASPQAPVVGTTARSGDPSFRSLPSQLIFIGAVTSFSFATEPSRLSKTRARCPCHTNTASRVGGTTGACTERAAAEQTDIATGSQIFFVKV